MEKLCDIFEDKWSNHFLRDRSRGTRRVLNRGAYWSLAERYGETIIVKGCLIGGQVGFVRNHGIVSFNGAWEDDCLFD